MSKKFNLNEEYANYVRANEASGWVMDLYEFAEEMLILGHINESELENIQMEMVA